MTVAVWTAAISNLALHKRFASKSSVRIQLTTEPRSVRILVKGEKTIPTGHIETPTTLNLTPGRRRIRIARDGYRAHDMTIEGEAGDQINLGQIVLERDPALNLGKLAIRIEGGSVWYELNDGLVNGDQNLELDDLVIGTEHVLSVALVNEPGAPRQRCRIILQESHAQAPYVLTIKRIKSKNNKVDLLKIAPCERSNHQDKKRSQRSPGTETSLPEGAAKN